MEDRECENLINLKQAFKSIDMAFVGLCYVFKERGIGKPT